MMRNIEGKCTNMLKEVLLSGAVILDNAPIEKSYTGRLEVRYNEEGIRVLLKATDNNTTYRIWGPVKLEEGDTLNLDGIHFIDTVKLV